MREHHPAERALFTRQVVLATVQMSMSRGTKQRADLRSAIASMQATFVRTNPVRALEIWHRGEHQTLALRRAPKVGRHETIALSIMAAQLPDLCAAGARKPR